MQLAVVEFARNVLGLEKANSREFDPKSKHHVIDLMNEQNEVTDKGGTMRLGSYPCELAKGSLAQDIYASPIFRASSSYEVNPAYFQKLESKGLHISGKS